MMRSFAYVLLVAAAAAGCGETAAPTLPADSGRDAAIDLDGGIDAGDGSVDDGGIDGSIPDGGPDGGAPDGGGSWCNTSTLCPACPDMDALCDEDNPCATGEVCLLTGCDDFSRCFVAGGGACQDNDDCSNPAYECNLSIGRCLRIDSGCDNSNDCVAGFACESNACVDRRVPCETGSDCPHGFACRVLADDQRFCRRVTRPCDANIDCQTLGVVCGDVEGDGPMECMAPFDPNQPDRVSCENSQCLSPVSPVCELTEEGTQAVCGQFGLCVSAADCAAGFECRDLWGDGRSECVLLGGSCADSTECPPREVCASPRIGGSPSCVSGATM